MRFTSQFRLLFTRIIGGFSSTEIRQPGNANLMLNRRRESRKTAGARQHRRRLHAIHAACSAPLGSPVQNSAFPTSAFSLRTSLWHIRLPDLVCCAVSFGFASITVVCSQYYTVIGYRVLGNYT